MQEIQVRNLKEPNLSGSFAMSHLDALLAECDMLERIHRHNFYFILAIEKGDGEHQVDFANYPIKDYSIFFLRPGQVHQLLLKAGSKGYLMGFVPSFISTENKQKRRAFRLASLNNYYQLDAKTYRKYIPILECIFNEYANKELMYLESIRANLDLLFIELFRHTKNANISTGNNAYVQALLEDLLEMLEIHIYENKQVSYYAQKLKLTSYQINAITKKTLGKTCSQLINERITLEAKRNLMASSSQVKEIAYHLGFEDPSYFIRFFKKQTGQTPESFRQNFK
ncbi:helix-turn-helix domain-containing protein [Ancylomarina salipaludis]|uniref:Helix-turn-helix domain-containing protein n=1 Tax=Ancylomarina salipaludis TaxID=2501299 RepID=A0A4Q1JMT9_9BACT|nr:helix-turn-helix domain-containing protein [Ancylomarina salipaludis]RXQ95862.1 helix-turn-helix domain-containing protein [Ancylomarina salipaludis]